MDIKKLSNNADVLVRIVVYALVLFIVMCGLVLAIRHLVQSAQEDYRADVFRHLTDYIDLIEWM